MNLRSWAQNGTLLNALLATVLIMAMMLDLALTNGVSILALNKARLMSQLTKLEQEARALGLDTSGAADAFRHAISTSDQNIAQIEATLLGEAEIGQWLVGQNAAASRLGLVTLRLDPDPADAGLAVRRYNWLLIGADAQLLALVRQLEKGLPTGVSLSDVTLLLNGPSSELTLVVSAVLSPTGAGINVATRQ